MFPRGNSGRMKWLLFVGLITLFIFPLITNPTYEPISPSIIEDPTNKFQVSATESEWLDCNAHDTVQDAVVTNVGNTPYLDQAEGDNTHYVWSLSNGAQSGWFDFPSTTGTGTLTVNISIFCNNDDGPADDKVDVMVDYTGSGAGADVGDAGQHTAYQYDTISLGTHTVTEVNALRVWFDYVFSGGKDEVRLDQVRIGVSWEGAAPQEAPVNDQAPSISNIDDTDNLYAQYKEYQMTVYVSDANGFADIDYLEVGLWDNTQTTEYWRFRYDEDTDTFTEEYDSGTVVSLNAGSSSATETGNDIDATFYFTVDWDHPDITDADTKCYVIDDEPESDTDWYEVNWDIETRLDYSVAPAVTSDDGGTIDIGDLDETFLLGGTLIYYTSTDDYPPTDQVDVWVSAVEYGTQTGPWSDLTLTSGAFSVTCYADNAVGAETYTIKPVIEAAGAGGTSLYYTTDLTDDYTATQVQVQSYSTDDGRININIAAGDHVTLYYAHDSSYVTAGTVTVNGVSASYSGSNGVWDFGDTKATVQQVIYNTVAISGDTHGLTGVDQNSQTLNQIWDEIIVISYTIITPAGDDRVDISTTVTIDVELHYSYDSTDVVDGTVTVNSLSTTYQSLGKWRFTDSEATVMANTYNDVQATGNTEGITVEDNTVTQQIIWDQIIVISYTVSDSRDNINDDVTIDVTLDYDYDDSDVTDGTVTINGIGAAHQGSGVWRITENKATVQQVIYDTVACSGNAHGITDVNQNSQSDSVIWDRIQVQSYTRSDDRDNIGDDVTIDATLWYDYDDSLVTDGTVTINTISASHQGSGVWRITENEATVQLKTYNTVACSGNTHGISTVDQNSQSTTVIWDRIQVQTTVIDDGRVSINNNVEIRVTLWLDYDDSYLGSGDSVTLDDVSMTWDSGNSWFDLSRSKATVGLWNYYVNSSSEATYGITALDLNSQDVDAIFDKLLIDMQADDETPANGIQVTFTLTITYDYDDTTCTTYQIVVSRDVVWWHSFTNSNKSLFVDTDSDVSYDYTTDQVTSESTYGITAFSSNTETVTWAPGNYAPVNDTAPVLTNPDDTDFLYSWIRYYIITSNVSDQDGYTDITYVELSLWNDAQSSEVWRVRYTVSGSSFSVELGSVYISLSGSSVDESGNDIDITWSIRIDWDHVDLQNIDVKQYVIDSDPESDTDWYESDWNVETRLDILNLAISASRGKTSRNDLVISGKVIYFGSASEISPTTALVDVWADGPISDKVDYDLTSGQFSISGVESSATVNLDVYIIRVVIEGTGVGGTELTHALHTCTYISDMLKVTLSTTTPHVDPGVEVTIDVAVVYAYDDSAVSSYFADILRDLLDFVTINETDPSFTDMEDIDASHYYSISGANETLYGIEEIYSNNQLTVVWGIDDTDAGPGYPRTDDTTTTIINPQEGQNFLLLGIGLGTMFVILWMTKEENPFWRRR